MSDELFSIEEQIAALQAKKKAILEAKRDEVLKEVKKTIATYSFTPTELGFKGKKNTVTTTSTAEPKYRNPKNLEQTWAGGKGATPKWIKEHETAGGSRDDFLINK